MVDFDKDGIARFELDGTLQALDVCDQEVIAYQLKVWQLFGEGAPVIPVIFAETIFYGSKGVFLAEYGVAVDHLGRGERGIFSCQDVCAVFVEFAGGDIEGKKYVYARLVAGLFSSECKKL